MFLFIKENGETVQSTNKVTLQQLRDVVKADIAYSFKQSNIKGQLKSFMLVGVKAKGQLESPINNEKLEQDSNNTIASLTKGDYLIIKDIIIEITSSKLTKSVSNICMEVE